MRFDRYTILKWKESAGDFAGTFGGGLIRLYAVCNATAKTRLFSLGVLGAGVLLVSGLVKLLQPEPPVPLSKQLVLTRTDEQGTVWKLDYLKDQDWQAILSGPVKPGEPLTATVEFFTENRTLHFLPEIIGEAGERYFPGILKNGQWQPPPRFVLTDQTGKLLLKGQFEYG